MVNTIYHITSADEPQRRRDRATYAPNAFEADGFIHCWYPWQVLRGRQPAILGRTDLVLMEIDRAKLTCEVIDENLEGGADLFPHIYGRLPMSAVIRIHPFPCGADGRFDLPGLPGRSG